MINKKEKVENNGQITLIIKGSTCLERKMEKENLYGLMEPIMMGNGKVIR